MGSWILFVALVRRFRWFDYRFPWWDRQLKSDREELIRLESGFEQTRVKQRKV